MQTAEQQDRTSRKRLTGKVALVTDLGSASGVAIARRFVLEGAHVAACPAGGTGRTGPGAEPKNVPPGAFVLDGDVCAPGIAQRIVSEVSQRFGRLDILVNHGGGGRILGTILDIPREEFDAAMAGDVWSVIALSSAAIPLMVSGGGGSIINIVSIGRLGLKGRPLRAAGAAAVSTLTISMALDHAADNIRVNALALGPTLATEPPLDPAARRELLAGAHGHAPMGALHTAEDVAAAALFLASDEARYVTGTVVTLDAGRSLPNH